MLQEDDMKRRRRPRNDNDLFLNMMVTAFLAWLAGMLIVLSIILTGAKI
jgi:hypothetical protein